MAKSWSEKFDNGKVPIVAPSIRTIAGRPPGARMLIPIPSQVDDYIRSIPSGETRTTIEMGNDLARHAGADLTCPSCCGVFLRICSEKAYQELQSGVPISSIAPFWRMAPPRSSIRKKLSFGDELIDSMLELEKSR